MKQRFNFCRRTKNSLGVLSLGVLAFFGSSGTAFADSPGDYRSAASGNWNDTTTWQTFDGSNWVAASDTPTSEKVTIQTGDTVDVTRRVAVDQVIVQFGGTITNAQNLTLGGSGTALDIFGTVHAEGLQTAADGTILTNTIWPLAFGSSTIVENGGNLAVNGGDLDVDGTLLVAGGTVTTASGDDLTGSGTLTISNGTVTVGAPGQGNDFSVNDREHDGRFARSRPRVHFDDHREPDGRNRSVHRHANRLPNPPTHLRQRHLFSGTSGVMNLNLGEATTSWSTAI